MTESKIHYGLRTAGHQPGRQAGSDIPKGIKKPRAVFVGLGVLALTFGIVITSLNLKEIRVSGNSRYTAEELTRRIFPGKADKNAIYCYAKDFFGEHVEIPFVEDYRLVFHSPFKVEVIVHEKSVVGYVSYMSSYMYFDKDGIIVESTNEKVEDIPRIVGLDYGQIVLHRPLPVEDERIFREILDLTQTLSKHDLKVDRVEFDSRGDATLYMEALEVFLGDSSNIAGKIVRLSNILPELAGLTGILYLDTYDPSNSEMAYTFKKKS